MRQYPEPLILLFLIASADGFPLVRFGCGRLPRVVSSLGGAPHQSVFPPAVSSIRARQFQICPAQQMVSSGLKAAPRGRLLSNPKPSCAVFHSFPDLQADVITSLRRGAHVWPRTNSHKFSSFAPVAGGIDALNSFFLRF